jgi:hypothetical protein
MGIAIASFIAESIGQRGNPGDGQSSVIPPVTPQDETGIASEDWENDVVIIKVTKSV